MAEMSMNKAIHGAFRRDLARFTAALSSLPPGDVRRGNQIVDVRAAVRALMRGASADDVSTARAAFERLQAVTIAHLDHEEAELEPVYLAKEDTPELKAMGRAFGKVSPARGGRFFAWVTDGASPEELEAVKRDVPGPVFAIIGGIFGRGYRKEIAPLWKS